MRVIQSPTIPDLQAHEPAIFLAGSIDMGSSIDWQGDLIDMLAACQGALLNPRRQHWDPAWPAEMSFPTFREQVEWELAGMEAASLIAFYFAPGSQAPVTLLELGLAARSRKAIVCCPPGYWRKGNVDVVCQHYGLPTVSGIEALAQAIQAHCESATHARER